MAVGLRIRNASNVVQIDSNFQNLALRQQGSVVSAATPTGGTGWSWATITVPASGVVAYRCAAPCYILDSSPSGGTRTVTFWVKGLSVTVAWYLFDTADLGQSYGGTVGLRVRNPAGAVAFDSRMKYMRVIDQLSGGAPTGAVNETHTYASTTLPALVQGQARYIANLIPLVGSGPGGASPVQYVFQACAGSMSGAVVTIADGNPGAHTYDSSATMPAGLATAQYYFDFMVIDVANL